MHHCGRAWSDALRLCRPDRMMYNTALLACRGSGKVAYAFQLVAQMRRAPARFHMFPDRVTYTALVNTCTAAGDLDLAQRVWNAVFASSATANIAGHPDQPTERRVSPDGAAYSAGIIAFANDPTKYNTALAMLQEAERAVDKTFRQSKRSRNAQPQSAKQLQKRRKALSPGVSAYRAVRETKTALWQYYQRVIVSLSATCPILASQVIKSVAASGKVRKASRLLSKMDKRAARLRFLRPDSVSPTVHKFLSSQRGCDRVCPHALLFRLAICTFYALVVMRAPSLRLLL